MMRFRVQTMLVLLGFMACVVMTMRPAAADEVATAGRAIASKWKDSLVTVTVSAKITMTFQGESSTEEHSGDVAGVVIDPSGLIAVSLVAADPVAALANLADDAEAKISAEMTSMKILLPDGTEVDGKIVLRDADLDLAFIRPLKKPAKPMVALDLTKSSQPELLDQVVLIYRLKPIANRALNVTVDRVEAIIEKPRKEYVLGVAGFSQEDGVPVFALDGTLIGIQLCKIPVGKSADYSDDFYVVRTASDIAEVAAQAPAEATDAK